ncbi:YgiT-type zinc finger protein [candidate division KSB1 bacterium]|nr:YgiT-type zinc finger protein [candidate division KSB1 bacterium]
MKCIVCNSPDIKKKKVEEEIKIGNDVAFVSIEVLVCNGCGERYYDRRTMKELESIEKNIKERNIQLEEVGRILKPTGT